MSSPGIGRATSSSLAPQRTSRGRSTVRYATTATATAASATRTPRTAPSGIASRATRAPRSTRCPVTAKLMRRCVFISAPGLRGQHNRRCPARTRRGEARSYGSIGRPVHAIAVEPIVTSHKDDRAEDLTDPGTRLVNWVFAGHDAGRGRCGLPAHPERARPDERQAPFDPRGRHRDSWRRRVRPVRRWAAGRAAPRWCAM